MHKIVDGELIELSPEEEAEFLASVENIVPPVMVAPIYKAELWRKTTDAEAEAIDAAFMDPAQVPVRLRRIFEAAVYLIPTDPDFPAIVAVLESVLGEERAAEILAA